MPKIAKIDWTVDLIPAYGKQYSNRKALEQGFREGKDFKGDYSLDFMYCSIRDFAPGTPVTLHFEGMSVGVIV